MEFDIPLKERSIIKVIGVGGGGSNAVNHMYRQGIVGVDFAICNTDNQALEMSPVPVKIQLGPGLTEGRGAGSKPEVGKNACIESIEDVKAFLLDNTKMVFITAGMGGGTGTGAAPIIAKTAKDLGILTVGIVTLPFGFEGKRREGFASEGLETMRNSVDALIVISNDKLRDVYGNLSLTEAFSHADNVLTTAAKGIAEIITVAGLINVDFEDVNTVMRDSGVAIMGSAVASGPDRARKAVEQALSSSLLRDNDIRGAKHVLLNITSGSEEATMDEIGEITNFVQTEAGFGTDLIWGNCFDPSLNDKMSITIIATGFEVDGHSQKELDKASEPLIHKNLDEDVFQSSINKAGFEIRVNGLMEESVLEGARPQQIELFTSQQHADAEPFAGIQANREEGDLAKQREEERREQLRRNSIKLYNSQAIQDLENVPAYRRRNVMLEDVSGSSERHSRYMVSADPEPQIRRENAFLHDKAD
jgi:cell division protein FtsZ